ncbi:MAG: LPS assembly protein LptD [Gammaproteobacteria bacterium]|nr:LPS assembly protein LptD [Gammaproteobacteria bacterium]
MSMLKSSTLNSLLTGLLLATASGISQAENEDNNDLWGMCSDSSSVFKTAPVLPTITDPEQIDISAGSISLLKDGSTFFENNVLIEKKGFRLSTDKLSYNKKDSTLSLPAPSHIESEKMSFNSDSGEMNSETETSSFSNVNFVILSNHMQGSSPFINIIGKDSTFFSNVTFSSCEPKKETWTFSADKLELDHNDESGSARNVVIKIKDVPIFYLPYISFPLGERRRSGILAPEISFSSGINGNKFSLPYYWNIAPNQDATITPVYLENRGLQLINNYRYLTSSSKGEIDFDFLKDDKLTDEDRYYSKVISKTQITRQLSFNINSSSVSDSHYLSDFGQSLTATSISHLQQSVDFQYRLGNWRSKLLEQQFQTTDDAIAPTSRPYRREPQLTVKGSEILGDTDVKFSLSSEWVNFTHLSDSKDNGYRTDLYPKLSWSKQGSSWFFKPSIGQRFTAYDLIDGSGTELDIDDRNLSIFQIDSGLFFERNLSQKYTQTLEPRLYYLNVPTVDQSAIPLFDTSEPDFSFAQLFRDNRFIGADRVADANQLTTALTSRIINDENGNELFSASIGQIYYFDDREVNLAQSDNTIQTASTSDIAAEFKIRKEDWTYRFSVLQNTENNDVEKGSFRFHYQTDNRHIFNLAYRFRRDDDPDKAIDQTDISIKWPVSDHWSGLARWNYSHKDHQDLANIIGFEYNSCCWAFRIIGKGHLTQDASGQDVFDRSVIFSLVLKGLGSFGKANQELERAILGFHPEH